MLDSSTQLQHPDPLHTDDETLEREARAHLTKSPHLQVVAELMVKLRSSNFAWWSPTFTRSQWRALPRMQWLSQRADVRQRATSLLTGLPRNAARSKTPEFQAALVDAVLEHGDVTALNFEEAFAPQDLVNYGPAAEIWAQFCQRMPWGDDGEVHQKLIGWLLRVLLNERSTLEPDMLRTPVLTAWDVRTAIDPRIWQERIPLELRAAVDEARLKREKARPREAYCARQELMIVTPDLIAQHIPLGDLLPVIHVAEQAMFGPREQMALVDSGAFPVAPSSRSSIAAGSSSMPPRSSAANGPASVIAPRPLAVAR